MAYLRALLVAPDHDYATHGSHAVAKTIADWMAEKGVDVTLVENNNATRGRVALEISRLRPSLIIYLGHGEKDLLYGQVPPGNSTPLIKDTINPHVLQGTTTIAIACLSLDLLGNAAVCSGCDIYIGSNAIYYLPGATDDRNYLEDFTRCILPMVVSLVQGESAADALNEYKALCLEYEKTYEEIGTEEALTVKTWMASNRLSMKGLGEAAGGIKFMKC